MPLEACETADGTPGVYWAPDGACHPCESAGGGMWDCEEAQAAAEADAAAEEADTSAVTEREVMSETVGTRKRNETIDYWEARTRSAMAAFLMEVERIALRQGSPGVPGALTAAGDDFPDELPSARSGPIPLTFSTFLSAWLVSMRDVIDGLTDLHIESERPSVRQKMEQRIAQSGVPDAALTSVKSIMAAATGGAWSRSKLAQRIADAFSPKSRPTVEAGGSAIGWAATGDDPLADTGMTWEATGEQMGRTEAANAYNSAALERINGMGEPGMHKRWVSHHDERTRKTHRDADGQTVPADAPFHVGRDLLMYPGDSSGSPGEVINCRCGVVAVPPDEEGRIGLPPTDSGMYQGAFGGYNGPEE